VGDGQHCECEWRDYWNLKGEIMQLGIGARCRGQRLGEGGTIRFRKTGTKAIFIYGTNSGLARLELNNCACCGAAFRKWFLG